MYLDAKRIAIGLVSGIFALFIWWVNDSRNANFENQIEEMETGVSSNPEKIAAQIQSYQSTVDEARALLKQGRLEEASRLLYHGYPKFESYLNYKGQTEINPGLTLRQWHDQIASELTDDWLAAYEAGKRTLIEGGYSRREFTDILNHVPFPYIGPAKSQWHKDRPEIEKARAVNASQWVLVAVYGSMAGSKAYEEKVEETLREKWPSGSDLKLVFGGAMSDEEKRAAARVISIFVEGDEVSYQFVGADDKRGSRQFHENLVATFELQGKSERIPSTSWDAIPQITAHHKAPESLTVTFDRFNEKQQADFSRILDEQSAGLLTEFKAQLEAIPLFAQL